MRKVNRAVRAAQLSGGATPFVSVASIALLAALLALGIGSGFLLFGAAGVATLSAAHYAGAHRTALREREEQLAEVAARLDRADAEHRSARARMHEIRSTVAGIASATQLLKSLPEDRRESFESMVDAEMDRVIRILRDDDTADPRPLALDEPRRQLGRLAPRPRPHRPVESLA